MSSRRSELTGSRVAYSPGERDVFSHLAVDRPRDTGVLTGLHYALGQVPFNGRRVVSGLLSSLARKVVLNREPFRVRSSPRAGPNPKTFWLESTARRGKAGRERPVSPLPSASGSRDREAGQ